VRLGGRRRSSKRKGGEVVTGRNIFMEGNVKNSGPSFRRRDPRKRETALSQISHSCEGKKGGPSNWTRRGGEMSSIFRGAMRASPASFSRPENRADPD